METPSLLIAFLGGLILFASPCVAPLIPAYLASISGVRLSELQSAANKGLQLTILKNAAIFVLGFSIVFILLGMFIGVLSSQIASFQTWLNRIGGILIMLFAFLMLFDIPLFGTRSQTGNPGATKGYLRTALMGVSFGISWTPCSGPVLASILALSATTASISLSAQLMTAFSFGLAIPFLITGFFTVFIAKFLSRHPKILTYTSRVAGLMLLALGILIFTGRVQGMVGLFYNIF